MKITKYRINAFENGLQQNTVIVFNLSGVADSKISSDCYFVIGSNEADGCNQPAYDVRFLLKCN